MPMIGWLHEFRADLRTLGLVTAIAGVTQSRPGPTLTLPIPGIGPVKIRRGNSDYAVLRQIFRNREYAVTNATIKQRLTDRYNSILAGGRQPLIIDAGANIGLASLWFKAAYPDAAIAAIEPDPANFKMLRLNIDGRAAITPIEAAIGASSGFVTITRPRQSWGFRTERAAQGCPLITMQDAFATYPEAVPFIAKIDIEGFERDLFASNLAWIDQCFAIYIEPHDWMLPGQHSSANFQKAMGTRAFELLLVGENLLYVKV